MRAHPFRQWASALLVVGFVWALLAPLPADAASPAPGPRLGVTAQQLDQAMSCSGPLRGIDRDPVLLTPAFSTAEESYGAGYARQLPAVGITTCTLSLPGRGFGDLQRAAEYDVAAVRLMSTRSGRKVVLLGHQHGALDALWALRFWPDVAAKVSDFISLATPYNGTTGARSLCSQGLRMCPPALWQIATDSRFLTALNAKRPPRGPSYTSIATAYDALITPQPFASSLRSARNIQLQSICPGRPIEHFTILLDNLAYRLVLDALAHRGPANPARIPASVCRGPLYLPGVAGPGGLSALAGAAGFALGFALNVPLQAVPAEPTVRRYARKR